jgi:hypothetical protein
MVLVQLFTWKQNGFYIYIQILKEAVSSQNLAENRGVLIPVHAPIITLIVERTPLSWNKNKQINNSNNEALSSTKTNDCVAIDKPLDRQDRLSAITIISLFIICFRQVATSSTISVMIGACTGILTLKSQVLTLTFKLESTTEED